METQAGAKVSVGAKKSIYDQTDVSQKVEWISRDRVDTYSEAL